MSTTDEKSLTIDETATTLAVTQNEHSISLADAAALTANFRNANPHNPALVLGGNFSRAIIDQILAQNGCQGIRYYYGQDSSNVPHVVLVGTDANGNDLYNGTLAEKARLSPPSWPQANPLNGL